LSLQRTSRLQSQSSEVPDMRLNARLSMPSTSPAAMDVLRLSHPDMGMPRV
jgi:hypothetical protein